MNQIVQEGQMPPNQSYPMPTNDMDEDLILDRKMESFIDRFEVLQGIRRFSWLIVIIILVFTFLGYRKAETTPRTFRAIVTMFEGSGLGAGGGGGAGGAAGGAGQLASLVGGLGLGGGGGGGGMLGPMESAGISLNSRSFMYPLIEEHNLRQKVFYDRWDPETGQWRNGVEPSLEETHLTFSGNVSITPIKSPPHIQLAYESTSRELAAELANDLVVWLNERHREIAIEDSRKRIEFLTGELDKSQYVEIQQAISSLFEGEIRKAMNARIHTDFLFKVIDWARIPKESEYVRPNKNIIIIEAAASGVGMGLLVTVILHLLTLLLKKMQARRRPPVSRREPDGGPDLNSGLDPSPSPRPAESETGQPR